MVLLGVFGPGSSAAATRCSAPCCPLGGGTENKLLRPCFCVALDSSVSPLRISYKSEHQPLFLNSGCKITDISAQQLPTCCNGLSPSG